jgi:hypothetical protein
LWTDGWGLRRAWSRKAPWSRWYCERLCAGMDARRPHVEPVIRPGVHAARPRPRCPCPCRAGSTPTRVPSLIALSWTSARCAASGPPTRTTEPVRRGTALDERAAFSVLTSGACSSLATAIRLRTTRRNSRPRQRSPQHLAWPRPRCPAGTDSPPSLDERSIRRYCQGCTAL